MKKKLKKLFGIKSELQTQDETKQEDERKFSIPINGKVRYVKLERGCVSFRLMPSESAMKFKDILTAEQVEIGRQIANMKEEPSKDQEKELQMTFTIGAETVKIYPPKATYDELKKSNDVSSYLKMIKVPQKKKEIAF